jgi:hypothetical protein
VFIDFKSQKKQYYLIMLIIRKDRYTILVIIVAYYVNYLLRKRTFDIEKKLNEMSLQRDEIEALYQEITATRKN